MPLRVQRPPRDPESKHQLRAERVVTCGHLRRVEDFLGGREEISAVVAPEVEARIARQRQHQSPPIRTRCLSSATTDSEAVGVVGVVAGTIRQAMMLLKAIPSSTAAVSLPDTAVSEIATSNPVSAASSRNLPV